MKFMSLLAAGLCSGLLAACSPQAAAEMREGMIASVFPNPADRQGIMLAFPLESHGIVPNLEVVWRPSVVSQDEVTRRVRVFCGSQGPRLSGRVGLKAAAKDDMWKLQSGELIPVRGARFRCLSS